MKKLICFATSMALAALLIPTVTLNSYAATEPDDDTDSVVIDGNEVYYSNSKMNGGIYPETSNTDKSEIETAKAKIAMRPMAIESKSLHVSFETQKNNYYCGPAAARMVLCSIGIYVSQDYLAGLLGTNPQTGTPGGPHVADVLNQVCAGSRYKFTWEWHKYVPDQSVYTIKGHIVEAISYGNAVLVDTWEKPGDYHITGHNIGTDLYHYGVVNGFTRYGDVVVYTDPGYGLMPTFKKSVLVEIGSMDKAVG